jgi:quinolinate synthase
MLWGRRFMAQLDECAAQSNDGISTRRRMIKVSGQLPSPLHYAKLPRAELTERIRSRKTELNAVILGHYYQRVEIQDVADFLGDSLRLSQQAAETDADTIIFCGVHFMAETAKIISPEKMVLMPDLYAGCPMADFVTGEALRKLKARHPGAVVVAYVNSTAAVKAESDICCTSANAVRVVQSIPRDRTILFVPDKNLAQYVADQTGRTMISAAAEARGAAFGAGDIIAWDGHCYVHDDLVLDELEQAIKAHPDAKVVIHPEARSDLLDRADFVVSTSGMAELAAQYDELIIGTERGLIDRLQQQYPNKTLIPLSRAAVCGNMKVNTLAKLAWSLDHQKHEVTLNEDVRVRAEAALRRMLDISGGRIEPTVQEKQFEDAAQRARGCGCG